MSGWKEADAGNGKKYYYNATTRETRWEKPEGFDDTNGTARPESPAVPTGPAVQPLTADHIAAGWADAKAPNGRTYYYNRHTQETKWEYPAVGPMPQGPQHVAGPSFAAGGPQGMNERGFDGPPRRDRRDDRDHGLPQKPGFDGGRGGGMPWDSRPENTGFRGAMPAKTDEPEYATPELAREAFFKLLRKHNIKYNTPWTDAMRAVIRERDYRAIKDAKDRKLAFEDYCVEARVEEIGKEKERHAKLRDEFRAMLKTHEEIKHFTRWKTARPMIEREVVFRGTEDDEERRQLFEEYILELQRKHLEDQAAARDKGLHELTGLLRTLILDVDTKWNDAKDTVMSSDRFQTDETLRALNKLDVLKAFEHHLQYLERQANEVRQEKRRNKHTDDRKAREGFKNLLQEKLRVGQITAGSKWQDFVPQIDDDERYTALIGTEGSSPLDLFWDVVEDEERKVRSKRNDALDVLDEQRFEMSPATTVDEFAAVMKRDSRASRWSHQDMTLVHQRLMEKILKREEDNKAFAERSQRKAIDALRSVIKHLEPPVRVDDSYEDIKPKLEPFEEFLALDDDARKSAFAKHIRRLQEKAEDAERDRARRDRERERERDRDYRDRGSSRRSYDYDRSDRRHRTRTPETDAYEADRRKAQEARERSYRKASFGLTPPPREGERERRDEVDRYPARDRERSRDRRSDRERDRERYESMYERERREREMERERSYVSRVDPRDRGRDALDYGDEEVIGSRPGSVRKRRESDGSEGKQRDAKRTRTNKEPEGEAMAVDQKEDMALQSGSEEGEIEEV